MHAQKSAFSAVGIELLLRDDARQEKSTVKSEGGMPLGEYEAVPRGCRWLGDAEQAAIEGGDDVDHR